MPSVLKYSYDRASAVTGSTLSLAVSASDDHARLLFRGRAAPGNVVAAALLVVARVARSRFVMTAAERAAIHDPVLTVDESGLHVESFSDDCGVHARLTLGREALEVECWRPGTVNVDFNREMRAALARVRGNEPLMMSIGRDRVEVATADARVTERLVPLPDRWVRGFAEVQVATCDLPCMAEFAGPTGQRLLQELPHGRAGQADVWARPSPGGLRLSTVPGGRAVWLSGPDRVRLLEPLARHIRGLRVFARPDEKGSSAWAADLGGAHLVLTLSPHRSRGFTGEGAVLYALVDPQASTDAHLVEGVLGERRRISMQELAAIGLPMPRLERALTWMGAHGTLGYDPVSGEWFLRSFPFTVATLAATPPRIAGARKLIEEGLVTLKDHGRATVSSDRDVHHVSIEPVRCDCTWWRRHPGDRGPCRHILAVLISRADTSPGLVPGRLLFVRRMSQRRETVDVATS